MTIRRFPWRVPKLSDRSFKLFAQQRGLLQLLPRESRPALAGLLEIDPRKRWSLQTLLENPWVRGIDSCTDQEPGKQHVHHVSTAAADGHHRNNLVIMTSEPPGVVAEKERRRISQQCPPACSHHHQNHIV
jgi:hypothetical protein